MQNCRLASYTQCKDFLTACQSSSCPKRLQILFSNALYFCRNLTVLTVLWAYCTGIRRLGAIWLLVATNYCTCNFPLEPSYVPTLPDNTLTLEKLYDRVASKPRFQYTMSMQPFKKKEMVYTEMFTEFTRLMIQTSRHAALRRDCLYPPARPSVRPST